MAEKDKTDAQPAFGGRPGAFPGRPGRGGGIGGGPGAALAAPVEKAKDAKGTLRRLGAELRGRSGRLALVALMAVCSTAFTIAWPRLMGAGIDELFKAGSNGVNFGLIGRILAGLVALYAGSSLFNYAMGFLMAGVAQETSYGLRKRVLAKLHRLPMRWFDEHSHGDVLSRVTNEIGRAHV